MSDKTITKEKMIARLQNLIDTLEADEAKQIEFEWRSDFEKGQYWFTFGIELL
jgi:hypothetical protein